MIEITADRPSRTIRFFESHEEAEKETVRYWQKQDFASKMQAVTELQEFFISFRKIDPDAQGPKRVTRIVQRA